MILSRWTKVLAGAMLAGSFLVAQTANPKQPKLKSKAEQEAVMAIFQAQNLDARLQAANNLITKFADTDFKATAFYISAETYSAKGDLDNAVAYAERCLEADPQFYGASLLVARVLAQRTREFDLDKEEKLGRAEKLAKTAMEQIAIAPKPRPDLPDEQWAQAKKDFEAQAHEVLGMTASVRKKYEDAAAEFKKATELSAQQDPALYVRLGGTYSSLGKYDDAIAAFDKALADPNASPQVKKIATDEKIKATQKKGAAAKQ